MLIATHLSLGYGRTVLLEDVSLTLEPGTVTGLVAPNGFARPAAARPCGIDGARARGALDVDGTGPRDGSALRRLVFYAPGDATLLYPNLTARDHLRMAARAVGKPTRPRRRRPAHRHGRVAHKRVRALSQGMKQQLTLAIAYLTCARLPPARRTHERPRPTNVQLHSQILRGIARRGAAVVMSSHILDNVDAIADRIVFIKDRGLIEHDPAHSTARALELYRRLYQSFT